MIRYSISKRTANPQEVNGWKAELANPSTTAERKAELEALIAGAERFKYYPAIQSRGTLTLKDLAKHIVAHGSVFDAATLTGAVTTIVEHMREEMLDGYNVRLDDLGVFQLSVSAEGMEEFSADARDLKIKAISVNYVPFGDLKSEPLMLDAQFEYTPTKEEIKVVKESLSGGIVPGVDPQSYVLSFVRNDGSGNLLFTGNQEAMTVIANSDVTITATLNGYSVPANNISKTTGGIYLNNVISTGQSMTNAAVKISIPAVGNYKAVTADFKVSQTGPEGVPERD